jgi:hypothetical protein
MRRALACLNMHASISAALAGRRADPARHHGGRHRNRRRCHADGCRARYRPGPRLPPHADRHRTTPLAACMTGWHGARRRAGPGRAGRPRRWQPDAPAAAGRGRSPMPTSSARHDQKVDWTRPAREVDCHIPRPVAVSRRLVQLGSRPASAIARAPEAAQWPAPVGPAKPPPLPAWCWTTICWSPAGTAATVRLTRLQKPGGKPLDCRPSS